MTIATNFGFPAACLVAIAWWLSKKVFQPMLDANAKMVDSLTACNLDNAESLRKLADQGVKTTENQIKCVRLQSAVLGEIKKLNGDKCDPAGSSS